MQIHVIRPGDSLWALSRAYDTTVEVIASANEIEDPNALVIGQALVIPINGSYYFVAPGDSLYIISQRVNVPVNVLAEVNNIQDPTQLRVGMRLYIPPRTRPSKEVAAYIDPQTTRENTAAEINQVGEHLTYLNIFSYAVNRDASLTPPNDDPAIEAALNNNVAPLMVVTNFEEGTFSQEIATIILSSEPLQDTLFNNILAVMEEKGYRGIDFDFEYVGRENRERYNAFIARAVDFFRPRGYFVSSALAPKLTDDQIGTLYEGHDYAAHGEVLDFVFIMTYEWGWSGGA
ncbi:LysM peptidoglycan-binding domain-containing protein, partial [Alkalibaculum sp. M08DMB]